MTVDTAQQQHCRMGHGPMSWTQGGISQKTQKPYNASWRCKAPGCTEIVWIKDAPAQNATPAATYSPPTTTPAPTYSPATVAQLSSNLRAEIALQAASRVFQGSGQHLTCLVAAREMYEWLKNPEAKAEDAGPGFPE